MAGHRRRDTLEFESPSILIESQSRHTELSFTSQLTERHGNQAHNSGERHLGFMVVIGIVTIRSKTILLVVVVVAWYTFVGMDLFDVMRIKLLVRAARRIMVILFNVSSMLG